MDVYQILCLFCVVKFSFVINVKPAKSTLEWDNMNPSMMLCHLQHV